MCARCRGFQGKDRKATRNYVHDPKSPFHYVGHVYRERRVCNLPTVCRCPRPVAAMGLCQPCYDRKYRAENAETRRFQKKQWADANAARKALFARKSWLRQYGLTLETFDWLYESQGGQCAICSTDLERSGRLTHVDHDHDSGVVRGLLCRRCNRALGLLKDDETLMLRAVQYLRRSRRAA